MLREVLEYTPVSRETIYYNEDEVVVASETDVKDLVETAKANYAQTDERAPWRDMTHVAWIPPEIMDEWFRTGAYRDQAFIRKWVNDNANQCFRTRPGRV